jgi:hypothetical protein
MQWQETVELTPDKPSAREFRFPAAEAPGSGRSFRFAAGPGAKPDPRAAAREDYRARWETGTDLIPAGEYEVTFETTAWRERGGQRERVELKSPPVRLTVKGDRPDFQ